jgi:hypothetical protein
VVAGVEGPEDDDGGRGVRDVFLPVGDRPEALQVVTADDEELPRLKVERGGVCLTSSKTAESVSSSMAASAYWWTDLRVRARSGNSIGRGRGSTGKNRVKSAELAGWGSVSHPYRTTVTGTGDRRTTASATLPSRIRETPSRPWLPRTT